MNESQQLVTDEDSQELQTTKPQNLESYLRDNVFGDDFRVYEEKLNKLSQDVEKLHSEISDIESTLIKEISEVKAQYSNIPDNITQRIDNRIDELISRTENDLEKLSMLINEFATDFQTQIDTLRSETETMESSSKTERQVFADTLIKIGTQLKNEL